MNCFKLRASTRLARDAQSKYDTRRPRKGKEKHPLVPDCYVPLFTLAHVREPSIGSKSTVVAPSVFSKNALVRERERERARILRAGG